MVFGCILLYSTLLLEKDAPHFGWTLFLALQPTSHVFWKGAAGHQSPLRSPQQSENRLQTTTSRSSDNPCDNCKDIKLTEGWVLHCIHLSWRMQPHVQFSPILWRGAITVDTLAPPQSFCSELPGRWRSSAETIRGSVLHFSPLSANICTFHFLLYPSRRPVPPSAVWFRCVLGFQTCEESNSAFY